MVAGRPARRIHGPSAPRRGRTRRVTLRVGIGYDIHPFDPNRPLVLGGVRLDGAWGLRGHSDADVLLHAIGDACLGAAALGDLGDHFPDSDPTWRGAPSAVLLARILELVRARGLAPHNVDATVVAERPRLAPHRPAIRARVAELMGLPLDRVSVKASTNNGLGTIGRAEGVATFAVVLLVESGQVSPGQVSPGQLSGDIARGSWDGGAPAAPLIP